MFVKVAAAAAIPNGSTRQVTVGAQAIALFNVDGTVYALDDICPHAGCSLSDGELAGTTVTCVCHGSQFDVTSGALLRGPAPRAAKSFPARVNGGDIEVSA